MAGTRTGERGSRTLAPRRPIRSTGIRPNAPPRIAGGTPRTRLLHQGWSRHARHCRRRPLPPPTPPLAARPRQARLAPRPTLAQTPAAVLAPGRAAGLPVAAALHRPAGVLQAGLQAGLLAGLLVRARAASPATWAPPDLRRPRRFHRKRAAARVAADPSTRRWRRRLALALALEKESMLPAVLQQQQGGVGPVTRCTGPACRCSPRARRASAVSPRFGRTRLLWRSAREGCQREPTQARGAQNRGARVAPRAESHGQLRQGRGAPTARLTHL